jgi:hypothetical protein
MARTKKAQPTAAVAARLTLDEIRELERIAKAQDRTVSYLVAKLVRTAWPTLKDAA